MFLFKEKYFLELVRFIKLKNIRLAFVLLKKKKAHLIAFHMTSRCSEDNLFLANRNNR